jgi:hypothetical protein
MSKVHMDAFCPHTQRSGMRVAKHLPAAKALKSRIQSDQRWIRNNPHCAKFGNYHYEAALKEILDCKKSLKVLRSLP